MNTEVKKLKRIIRAFEPNTNYTNVIAVYLMVVLFNKTFHEVSTVFNLPEKTIQSAVTKVHFKFLKKGDFYKKAKGIYLAYQAQQQLNLAA